MDSCSLALAGLDGVHIDDRLDFLAELHAILGPILKSIDLEETLKGREEGLGILKPPR